MRFERFVRRYAGQAWAIEPLMLDKLTEIIEAQIREGRPEAGMLDELFGPVEELTAEVRDGVAVIPVRGVIDKNISDMDRHSGATDVDEIGALVRAAEANPDVTAIMLDVDNPGGTVTGVPEVADVIAGVKKPTMAYTDTLMASAAYWLSAGADTIYSSKSADVGSIGVYLPIMDVSKAYEQAGLRVDLIKAGSLKGAGYPGTSISDEQRADFQAGVDYIYDQFTEHVTARRNVPAATMQGQTFIGEQAVAAGLVDSLADRETAINDLRELAHA